MVTRPKDYITSVEKLRAQLAPDLPYYKIIPEPGQPEYELARAIHMAGDDPPRTSKSFDRMAKPQKQIRIWEAERIIRALNLHQHLVAHHDDIDGG